MIFLDHVKSYNTIKDLLPYNNMLNYINPLPHGVLATFSLTAGGLMSPPIKDDISRETTILMTSLRTYRTSAVSSQGLYYTYPPSPPCAIESSLNTLPGTTVYITA
jgi:hypothetical protein